MIFGEFALINAALWKAPLSAVFLLVGVALLYSVITKTVRGAHADAEGTEGQGLYTGDAVRIHRVPRPWL